MEVKRRAARTLVARLNSAEDETSLAAAIAEIRLLTKHDPEIRLPLVVAGAAPLLARRLVVSPADGEDAAAAILNLSISAASELLSATPGLLAALARALAISSPAAAANSAAAVYGLLAVESHRPIIGSHRGIVAALLALLRSKQANSVKDALKALFGIALHPPNRALMVELGAAAALFPLIDGSRGGGLVEDATAVVAQA